MMEAAKEAARERASAVAAAAPAVSALDPLGMSGIREDAEEEDMAEDACVGEDPADAD